jgi:diguanylate cyclase (GGDEF)-like protein
MRDVSGYLWLLAVVPPFLFAYHRGWEGAAAGLASAMIVLLGLELVPALVHGGHPDWRLTAGTAGVFLVVSLGAGWSTELLHRRTFSALQMAYADPLTGLGNRRVLEYFLERHVAGALRGVPAVVVMFDLDDFKSYNDRFGHPAGDEALVAFAHVLSAETRRNDLAGRMGGEEFLVVLSGTDTAGGEVFAERVRTATRRAELSTGATLSVSAGVAEAGPERPDVERLLADADAALYEAKRLGKDRVELAGSGVPVSGPPLAEIGPRPAPAR